MRVPNTERLTPQSVSVPIARVLIGTLAFKAVELAQAVEVARGAGGGSVDAIAGVIDPLTPIVIAAPVSLAAP